MDIDLDDWISLLEGELTNGFITYLRIKTKRGKNGGAVNEIKIGK